MKKKLFSMLCLLPLFGHTSFAQSIALKDVTDGLPKANFFASGDQPGEEYDRAFNNAIEAGNKWFRGNFNTTVSNPNWIGVNFGVGGGSAKTLTGYLLSSANDFASRNPRDWQFQGSNDGLTWTTLHTVTNNTFNYFGHSKIFHFSNTTPYLQYRLLITETFDDNESSIQIGEIEMYEKVAIEGYVKDNNDVPIAGVTVAILGETYSPTTGGTIYSTATTNASGWYEFPPNDIPNGQFSVIVQPPVGYQIQSHTLPLFRDPNWTNNGNLLSIPANFYTYTGAVPFQNHLQLPMPAPFVNWDNQQNLTFINRFRANIAKGNIDFVLKAAEIERVCEQLNGNSGAANNLITVAENGTFGKFELGTGPKSYLQAHPTQPGFSKDYVNTILYANEGFTNPTYTDYAFNSKANTLLSGSWGGGVAPNSGALSITSYIGTIGDIIDVGANPGDRSSSLVNVSENGWRKTYGSTTGDAYDKFLVVNGQLGAAALFRQPNLDLKANVNYLFSFEGKNANATTQTSATTVVTITYHVLNASNAEIATGTLVLPRSTSSATDHPSSAWNKIFTTLTVPTDGIYRLELRTAGGPEVGNDFYIDNISLRSLVDFGDAPSSYGLAKHSQSIQDINTSCSPLLFLGNTVDIENDDLASTNADGDDNNSAVNDDDGVVFPVISVNNTTAYTTTIQATNLTTNQASIHAWIDWNKNGVFDVAELQSVVVPTNTNNGTFTLTWNNLSVTNLDPIYARFRLSTDVNASNASSAALGGEVEDYELIPSASLPVRLINFNAQKQGQSALLTWATASEADCYGFHIEYSLDGKQWENIGFLGSKAPNGNSSTLLNYTFIHNILPVGNVFYRLKQEDFNGAKTYSPKKLLQNNSELAVGVYPNPAGNYVIVSGLQPGCSVEIVNMMGQVVKAIKADATSTQIALDYLPEGVYTVRALDASGKASVSKFLKQ